MDVQVRLSRLLPYMRFVTVLKLTMKMRANLDLRTVFTQCPDLQVLHIRTTSTFRLLGPWVPMEIFPSSTLSLQQPQLQQQEDHDQDHELKTKQGPLSAAFSSKVLALRELVLERAHFYQASLERLLCITPYLDTLRLIDLNRHSWLASYPAPVEYDQQRLIRFLQNPSFPQQPKIIPLKSFSFSIASKLNHNHDRDIQTAYKELSPTSREMTFYVEDLSVPLLKYLREEVANVVTTLELRYNDIHRFSPDPVLHRYMCSSPHLVHLKAPNTFYLVDLLDIHGRMESVTRRITGRTGGTNSLMGPPGIWVCKNLETLHLSFRATSNTNNSSNSTTIATGGTPKINSRIVFGYISRVCPELKDLQLRAAENFYWPAWTPHGDGATITQRQRLHLTLDSGFCLLARLTRLEQLNLGCISWSGASTGFVSRNTVWNLELVDLDWILEEGHRDVRRREMRRRVIAERWEYLLYEERVNKLQEAMETNWWVSRTRKMVPHSTTTNTSNTNKQVLRGRTDPEIHEQLKNLGLLVDVKDMLEEMEVENERQGKEEGREGWYFKCWPMLRWMQIYHSTEYGRSKEREVRRLLTHPQDLIKTSGDR
ncbi:hypothetical protein BGZ95_008799 [Linnemannia exigua]|uniref:Uncharacterized protein n=1 Tax=Linnemannia exigua TaxID=604196 RepID=A0AAD4DDU6_9FUNG|nr:hypothetical protein BGZ95_008799 [Linnemannia exigua]